MNYNRIYTSIVFRAKAEEADRKLDKQNGGYYERHHIIPRSLGGSNESTNLAYLTAREHFICHWLLVKMYPANSDAYNKMLFALWRMRSNPTAETKRYIFSNVYVYLREQFAKVIGKKVSISQRGSGNSQYGTSWYTAIDDGHSERFSETPGHGWIKGKNVFGLGRKYPALWCIKTKNHSQLSTDKLDPLCMNYGRTGLIKLSLRQKDIGMNFIQVITLR